MNLMEPINLLNEESGHQNQARLIIYVITNIEEL